MTHDVIEGDALERMSGMGSDSFDAMLCDPPYGIAFMGKEWDHGVPSASVWREALRVLKPGAFALVACGTRTQHRMVTALEDAGFEVRDVIAWLYGSGFPKSHDVSKAIDKAAGAERQVIGHLDPSSPRTAMARGIYGTSVQDGPGAGVPVTAPATPDAERWQGYGTALKPAMELWTLVRKPPDGTVAANCLRHGVGGLNIDGTRVGFASEADEAESKTKNAHATFGSKPRDNKVFGFDPRDRAAGGDYNPPGRWPANVIHDGSDEVLELFPDSNGGPVRIERNNARADESQYRIKPTPGTVKDWGDSGSAARFFYTAKASRREREAGLDHRDAKPTMRYENPQGQGPQPQQTPRQPVMQRNPHPTVKPIALTTYLARLLLPPERDTPRRMIVPFAGVGSEMIGARLAGWESVTGIEIDAEYARIARARIRHWTSRCPLFDEDPA